MRLVRHRHDLSFDHALTGDMGQLLPLVCLDVLPGDTFRYHPSFLLRVAPQANPVYHNVTVRVHNFFVPNRILWDGWEDFITGASDDLTPPTITLSATASERLLADHMGIEPTEGLEVDALPFYAYNLIWNEWFRDQDLDTERASDAVTVARIRWGRDYFTASRDVPQQGEAVSLNLSGSLPVKGIGLADVDRNSTSDVDVYETGDDPSEAPTSEYTRALSPASQTWLNVLPDNQTGGQFAPGIFADASESDLGVNINDLRNAISLQRIAEARAFFGERYTDYLEWYGVHASDGRLQRPEYLGGGRRQIAFTEVLATAAGTGINVGDLYGHGIAGFRHRPVRRMFEEHGWFFSLLSVRPKGVYQTGIPRRFLRRVPTDYWHRELELLPWQAVSTREIFGGADADLIFGYTPRFDEYRETNSYISGSFRAGQTEQDWTLSRNFSAAPTLNASFVECAPSDRIYSDTNIPEVYVNAALKLYAKRLVRRAGRITNAALF